MVRYVDFLETKSKDGILMHYGDETLGVYWRLGATRKGNGFE